MNSCQHKPDKSLTKDPPNDSLINTPGSKVRLKKICDQFYREIIAAVHM